MSPEDPDEPQGPEGPDDDIVAGASAFGLEDLDDEPVEGDDDRWQAFAESAGGDDLEDRLEAGFAGEDDFDAVPPPSPAPRPRRRRPHDPTPPDPDIEDEDEEALARTEARRRSREQRAQSGRPRRDRTPSGEAVHDAPVSGRGSRLAIVALVAAVIALGIGLDAAFPTRSEAPAASAVVEQSWFCPYTVGGGGADTQIGVANASGRELTGTVTFVPAAGVTVAQPAPVDLAVPRYGWAGVQASDVYPQQGAAIVSLPAGDVAVSAKVTYAPRRGRLSGVATYPCSSRAATRWFVPSGSTARGQQEYIRIFNPSSDTAVVKASFVTEAGRETPGPTQGITLEPRQRVDIAVHDVVIRRNTVAAVLESNKGQVVVSYGQLPDGGVNGFGETLAIAEAADDWLFSGGRLAGDAGQILSVFNPSDDVADIDVSFNPDPGVDPLPPVELRAEPDRRADVDLANLTQSVSSYGVLLSGDTAVAAAQLRFGRGYSLVSGTPAPATSWLIASTPIEATAGLIEVLNPGSRALTARVYPLTAEGADRLEAAGEEVEVGPASRVQIDPANLGLAAGPVGFLVRLSSGGVVTRTFSESADQAADVGTRVG